MRPVAVIAAGAVSALGEGLRAYSVGEAGEPARVAIREDAELRAAGLGKPFVARASGPRDAGPDPARVLLERATTLLVESLTATWPGWRTRRIAVSVGTSSGGMIPLTEALALRARGEAVPGELARSATYFGPLAGLNRALGVTPVLLTQVLAACASSGMAMGIGSRWLEHGDADLVIAGGYDAVSVFVAAGFESLGATSAHPSPFRAGRDGMALGEAAALVALARADDLGELRGRALGYLRGFGASADGVHVTAPDRTGQGLARAALAALADAGLSPDDVDLVSAHATSTPFNDSAEARALSTILGERAQRTPVHAFKASVGHTLGAGSTLELLSALDAMERSIAPASAGEGPMDPETPVLTLSRNEPRALRSCLKLSAAFGGANSALVATRDAGPGPALRVSAASVMRQGPVRRAADVAAIAGNLRTPKVQVGRMDPLSAAAVAAAWAVVEPFPEAQRERVGVVLGTATASIECNEDFDARLRERGARGVEPRRFPPTSPNLAAGQCSIALGLLGPSLAVGADHRAAIEALLVAHDLVAAGDADAMVVVAAEDVREAVPDLWRAAGWVAPEPGAAAALVARGGERTLDRSRLLDAWRRALPGGEGSGSAGPGLLGWALSRCLATGP